MSTSTRDVLVSLVALSWLAAGCSDSSKKIDLGGGCLLNSDCNSPRSCTFGKCHDTCRETRDCPLGQACVKTPEGGVCQFPADSDCQSSGGVCPVGLVCATDQRCRKGCQTAADCLAGQACSTSGACADSSDLDGNGQIVESGVGVACVTSAECNTSLTCAMNRCHYLCQGTNLCPAGQSCVNTGSGAVCQLPVEALCDGSVPCPGGLVCAVDYRCRAPCGSASDCTPGQKCAGGTCADSGDLNPSGQIPPKSPPVIPRDAGVDAPATGVGGDGGVGKDGAGGAIDVGSPILTGGSGGNRIDGAPGTGGVSAGGSGGSSGGSGATRDGGVVDAPADRPADTAIGRDVPLGPDVPKLLDGGGSTVLTGCGKVTTMRYFCDDFEGGLDNWHHATEGWGLTDKTYQSPGYSVTDSPNGNYPAGAKSEITMVGSVDLTGAVSPILAFWQRLDLNSSGTYNFDYAYVEASSDGGTTWTTVASLSDANDTSVWSFQQRSLASFVGKKIKLRFRLVDSTASAVGDGWYLDDVEIRETELPPGGPSEGRSTLLGSAETSGCDGAAVGTRYFCEDFESDLSGWLAATEGWNTVAATSQSPTHSVTDSPNGNYPAGAKSEITMAGSVDLTGAMSPILTFWYRLDLNSSNDGGGPYNADYVYVDASSDSGTSWTTVARFPDTNDTTVWSFQQTTLASFVGKKIKLRFRLVDNAASGVGDGWYLDDIKVRENEFVPASSDLALCSSQAAGAACNAADLCGKACGPDNKGSKSLTCSAAKFVDSACTFPAAADYSCYKAGAAEACPTGTRAGQACTATACQACGATTGTAFTDGGGTARQGFCVCSAGKWSCGTLNDWPCYPNPAVTGATVPESCN